jgi:hypothetical protein
LWLLYNPVNSSCQRASGWKYTLPYAKMRTVFCKYFWWLLFSSTYKTRENRVEPNSYKQHQTPDLKKSPFENLMSYLCYYKVNISKVYKTIRSRTKINHWQPDLFQTIWGENTILEQSSGTVHTKRKKPNKVHTS